MGNKNIEVHDTNGMITSRGTVQVQENEKQVGYSYFDNLDDDCLIDGTYIDGVYTAPTWEQGFQDAQNELIADDPKGIATGTEQWMKCVRYNLKGGMNESCKIDITAAFS